MSSQVNNYQIPEIPRAKIFLTLLFVPGVYLVLILSAVITVAIGGGLIYLLYYIFGTIFNRIPVGVMFLIAIGALIGVMAVLKGIIKTVWRKPSFQPAIILDLNQEPGLKGFIKNLCVEMSTEMPTAVIIHAEPTFFVSQGKNSTFNGVVKGRILAIGLPLLSTLTLNELRAILAHEFAHFTGNDTLYSSLVLPIYTGINAATKEMEGVMDESSNNDNKGYMSLPLLIPYIALNLYLNIFHSINMDLSRERERRADIIAVLTCGTICFSKGLTKVVGYGGAFGEALRSHILELLKNRKVFTNYYSYFRDNINQFTKYIEHMEDEAKKVTHDKNDSHPNLLNRLNYIPNIDERFNDNELSIDILNNVGFYEETLTEKYTEMLAYLYRSVLDNKEEDKVD